MKHHNTRRICCIAITTCLLVASLARADGSLFLENAFVKVGVDPHKGGAITWLSWKTYPNNSINIADPGRLIQQSYYAGKSLDRRDEGQSAAWSRWTWNPIQGGGVGSWARVNECKKLDEQTLYSETIPKLWDMPNEEAAAIMRQWTSLDPDMPNVISVRCEVVCSRDANDRWGEAVERAQEIPACYFTRNFDGVDCYLGDGNWRKEMQPPGPPWGRAHPPKKAMAFFASRDKSVEDQRPMRPGIAVFSPMSTDDWNFGPHGQGLSSDPLAGPCMHVAPLDTVALGPRSRYAYRYWLIVGDQLQIADRLEELIKLHGHDKPELADAN